MSDPCYVLSLFSHNHMQVSSEEVVASLLQLVNSGCSVSFRFAGYLDCSMCRRPLQLESERAALWCKHQVHIECLKENALRMSRGLDPSELHGLKCLNCRTLINYEVFRQAVGADWIEHKMAELAEGLAQQLHKIDRVENQKKLDEQLHDCGVCLEQFLIGDMVTFDCNHRFCKACSDGNIRGQLGEGKYKVQEIGCPQCKAADITEQTLRYCVGPEMTERILNFRHKNLKVEGMTIMDCKGYRMKKNGESVPLLEAKQNMTKEEQKKYDDDLEAINRAIRRNQKPPNIGQVEDCPGVISFREGDEGDYITCIVCKLRQCIKGCPVTHDGKTCEQYKASVKDNEMQDGGLEMLRKNGIKIVKCPNTKCSALINRVSGCDWVKCRCGCELCYICEQPWTGKCAHKNGHAPFDFAAFMQRQR